MDTQIKCRFCDAHNVSSALSCASCLMPIVDDFGEVGELTAPVAPAPIEYRPYTGPPKAPKTEPAEVPEPSPTQSPEPPPGFRIGGTIIAGANGAAAAPAPARAATALRAPGQDRIRWRWYHLWLFGVVTWGVPEWLGRSRGTGSSISGILSQAFAFQIIGYLLGLLVIGGFVWFLQNGDWSSLGIARTERSRMDVLRGALFGGAVFVAYLPVGLWLSKGNASLDYRATLVIGNASGVGLVLAALVAMVGAPIIEEIYYRGMLYEKLARKSRFVAVALSTILFTAAHGALFIPAITLLGFCLAYRRNKESLWFTIGAHSTWNAIVTVLAVVALTGASFTFASANGGLQLQYPRDWQRHTENEVQIPLGSITGGVDLALDSPNGSMIMVLEMNNLPSVPTKAELHKKLANVTSLTPMEGVHITSFKESELELQGDPLSFEMAASITAPDGTAGQARYVAVVPTATTTMYLFMVICPPASCGPAQADFEKIVTTATFSPTS